VSIVRAPKVPAAYAPSRAAEAAKVSRVSRDREALGTDVYPALGPWQSRAAPTCGPGVSGQAEIK
jgi:hypothetical protein